MGIRNVHRSSSIGPFGSVPDLTSPHGDQKHDREATEYVTLKAFSLALMGIRNSEIVTTTLRNRSKNSLALTGIRNIYEEGQPKTISTRPSLALMGIRNLESQAIRGGRAEQSQLTSPHGDQKHCIRCERDLQVACDHSSLALMGIRNHPAHP